MFDINTATATQLTDRVRALQEDKGLPISAESTLLRMKKNVILEKMIELMGNEFDLNAEGYPVRKPTAETTIPCLPTTVFNVYGVAGPDDTTLDKLADVAIADITSTTDDEEGYAEALAEEGIDTTEEDAVAVAYEPATPRPAPIVPNFTPSTAPAKATRAPQGSTPYTVTKPANKRPGTAAAARFALLQQHTTVEEFVAAVVASGDTEKNAKGTFAKYVRLGHIKVGG